MIFAIDIGNTNIVCGCVDENGARFVERISTVRTKTELEYAVDIKTILDIHNVKKNQIEGCMISSVVPQITEIVRIAAKKILEKEVKVLGPGIKTGLNIQMDNPGTLGADLVANYIGGMILPGVGISLDALTARASQLSGIAIEAPKHIIGKNTVDCMKSGVLYSSAGAIDGCIDRIEEELGEKTTVIATGGLAKKIIPHCRRQIILDDELLLKGLYVIYMKNRSVMC